MNDAALKIAVTSRILRGSDDARGAQREPTVAMSLAMNDAIINAGASAWLLPTLGRKQSDGWLDDIVTSLDGLILQGGPDIAASLYDASALATDDESTDRDRREIELLRRFIRAGKPVLGLCRGCQLINVAFGGTLHADLPSDRGDTTPHSDPARYVELEHPVTLTSDGFLHRLYGIDHGLVNSAHHQGIRQLGDDLETEATSPDGLIEGFRWRGASYVVGLQWHPEFHARSAHLLPAAPLFDGFVREMSRSRSQINGRAG